MKVLIFGIGNPGRQDDGLGAGVVDLVQASTLDREDQCPHELSFDANYQLNVEDAEAISQFDLVVFADASLVDSDGPYRLYRLEPEPTASFSTHSVSPGGILALCAEIYDIRPDVYMLAIRGYEWEPNAALTEQARVNMHAAAELLVNALCGPQAAGSNTSPLDQFVS